MHPEYLLLTKDPDEVHLLTHEGKTKLEFTPLRMSLDIGEGDDVTVVVAFLKDHDYVVGANIHQGSPTMHHMLQHTLNNPGVLGLQGMYRELCLATRLRGEAYSLVKDENGTIWQLVMDDAGNVKLNRYEEPVIYQQGRVISQINLINQLDDAQAKRIEAVQAAFDQQKVGTGFIMPRVD